MGGTTSRAVTDPSISIWKVTSTLCPRNARGTLSIGGMIIVCGSGGRPRRPPPPTPPPVPPPLPGPTPLPCPSPVPVPSPPPDPPPVPADPALTLSGGTGTSCCGSGVGSGMTVGTTTGGCTTGSTAGGGGGGGITATNAVPPVPPPPPPPGVWYGVKIDSPRSVTSVRPTLIASAMIATCNNRDRIAA